MERVLDQTCITYPETYVDDISGEQIKLILEDVCDNLFHPDPFYQQGGDMVRLGGLDYVCDPLARVGSRAPGPPIWDVVATYLRDRKVASIDKLNTPVLRGVGGNQGIAGYPAAV